MTSGCLTNNRRLNSIALINHEEQYVSYEYNCSVQCMDKEIIYSIITYMMIKFRVQNIYMT